MFSTTYSLACSKKVCPNELMGHWQREMWETAQKNAMAWKKSIILKFSHDFLFVCPIATAAADINISQIYMLYFRWIPPSHIMLLVFCLTRPSPSTIRCFEFVLQFWTIDFVFLVSNSENGMCTCHHGPMMNFPL